MHPPAPTASRRPPRMTVFDGATSEAGYAFNRFGFSLVREANRTRYLADPEGYMDGFAIPAAQRALFAARDWAGLVEAGASVYIVAKLTGMHGSTLLEMGAQMRGEPLETFRAWMRDPRRFDPAGNA